MLGQPAPSPFTVDRLLRVLGGETTGPVPEDRDRLSVIFAWLHNFKRLPRLLQTARPVRVTGSVECARGRVDRGTALNAALSPETDPVKAAQLSLAIIREADPPSQSTLELSADLSREDIEKLSLSEALALARQLGIEIPEASDQGLNVSRPLSAHLRSPGKRLSEAVKRRLRASPSD